MPEIIESMAKQTAATPCCELEGYHSHPMALYRTADLFWPNAPG